MSATFLLLTIPVSHYCEKARWALQRAGLAFHEEGHAPLLSRWASRRYGPAGTVPLLLTPSGVFRTSNEILRHADSTLPPDDRLFPENPEVEALVTRFDDDLGPHARRVAYFHGLPDRRLALALLDQQIPRWESLFLTVFFPIVRLAIARGLKVDPAGAARSLTKVNAVFAAVTERLEDGRAFLVDDRFTAADLTFAALAAPLLLPPAYGGRLPPPERWSGPMQAEVSRLRATPAGAFALRIYQDHRLEPPKMYAAVL